MSFSTAKFLGVVGAVLFVSSGNLRYCQAWLFLGLQLAWLEVTGAYFLRRDPALVERRLAQDERGQTEPLQRVLIAALRALGVVTLIVAGLDHRFAWARVPLACAALGALLFVREARSSSRPSSRTRTRRASSRSAPITRS
jgi:hypothetical protein